MKITKNDWFIPRIIMGIIMAIFLIYAWFVPTTDPATVYHDTHTNVVLAVIGTIMILAGAGILIGLIPAYDLLNDKRKLNQKEISMTWVNVGIAVLVLLGFGLIMI